LQDGDTLIVWKLDLLARSLRDLITLETLRRAVTALAKHNGPA
jgi:DNA invertase Pin-like site-specific DNA recombinase